MYLLYLYLSIFWTKEVWTQSITNNGSDSQALAGIKIEYSVDYLLLLFLVDLTDLFQCTL